MNRTRKFTFYWLPVIVYCLAIFFQSAFPSPEVGPQWPHMDKLMHVGGYALLGVLFLRAFLNASALAGRPYQAMLWAFLSASLYGASDELHQSFVAARQTEALDLLADAVGSALGVMGYWVAIHVFGKFQRSS
jgi:VanZ family protein